MFTRTVIYFVHVVRCVVHGDENVIYSSSFNYVFCYLAVIENS